MITAELAAAGTSLAAVVSMRRWQRKVARREAEWPHPPGCSWPGAHHTAELERDIYGDVLSTSVLLHLDDCKPRPDRHGQPGGKPLRRGSARDFDRVAATWTVRESTAVKLRRLVTEAELVRQELDARLETYGPSSITTELRRVLTAKQTELEDVVARSDIAHDIAKARLRPIP